MKISASFFFSIFAFGFATFADDTTQAKEVEPLNAKIAAGITKGELWTNDPSQIAAVLTGPWLSNTPDSEASSQSREVIATSEGEGNSGKVSVKVKEIGLFDDAVRQLDHTYEFVLKNGHWTVTAATTKAHDARPAFPIAESENLQKRRAGVLVVMSSTGHELQELAKANGIPELSVVASDAIFGNHDSLVKILKLSTKVDGAAAEIYGELVYGFSCAFESNGFTRFLYFNLEEKEREAVLEFIKWIESDVVPN
ncbi:hypothetical protein OAE61_00725 [Verrucomicrobiales bacterium]|nr:hypothetical protein [Verrucomicrobiales bacterium]MDC0322031.1 hypothetical protein [Verrucomicrobiales bacterium]